MRNSWRFFFVVEALLFLAVLHQMVTDFGLLFLLALGIFCIVYYLKRQRRSSFTFFVLITGLVLVISSLLSSPVMWLMLAFAIVFISVKGAELSGTQFLQRAPWRKKQMIMVETTNLEAKNGRRFKRPWFANERIGSNIYEWDDINIDILSGDTIIDLGNTLLPKNDSVAIIRKGLGRTRVLVPLGVAISLEHSTLYGQVIFEEEKFQLRNESLKLYSEDYDANPRRLKILTNSLVGDLEVIRI